MSVAQLVDRFIQIGIRQDDALNSGHISVFNHLFDLMVEVESELRDREGDQGRALLSLFRHPDIQVRLNAAKATLAVAPALAREELKAIADSRCYPQAGGAGMSLSNLDRGVFKPT